MFHDSTPYHFRLHCVPTRLRPSIGHFGCSRVILPDVCDSLKRSIISFLFLCHEFPANDVGSMQCSCSNAARYCKILQDTARYGTILHIAVLDRSHTANLLYYSAYLCSTFAVPIVLHVLHVLDVLHVLLIPVYSPIALLSVLLQAS
jgi:hypothetical protein